MFFVEKCNDIEGSYSLLIILLIFICWKKLWFSFNEIFSPSKNVDYKKFIITNQRPNIIFIKCSYFDYLIVSF